MKKVETMDGIYWTRPGLTADETNAVEQPQGCNILHLDLVES
jgi:hypothetical protein